MEQRLKDQIVGGYQPKEKGTSNPPKRGSSVPIQPTIPEMTDRKETDPVSYNIQIVVKVEGCDKYARVDTPDFRDPTYNLGKLFRACMDWDYSQNEIDKNGDYQTCYYKCDFVIEKVEKGLRELRTNRRKYEHLLPSNGWGTMSTAIDALESLRECIYRNAEDIPIECIYMSW